MTIKYPNNQYDCEISNKSELINVLESYKAKCINIYGTNAKSKIKSWFTYEVHLNIGPKNYIGLPGLVAKVKHLGRVTYLKSIDLRQKVNITLPEKGEKTTLKEYNNRLVEFMSYEVKTI